MRITLGDGLTVETGEGRFRIDSRRMREGEAHCLTHAHSDHLPSKVGDGRVICSPATLDCANVRLRGRLSRVDHDGVEMLPSGHTVGSMMFRIGDTLCTGDLSTRDRLGIEGARPVPVESLVIETTFGTPRHVMPPTDEVLASLRDWVEDTMSQGHPAIVYAYSLGKAQEVVRLLADHRPYLHGPVMRMTEVVSRHYDGMDWREYDQDAVEPPFAMVYAPPRGSSPTMGHWRRRGARVAAVSGWAVDPSRRYMMRTDAAFPLSDHADFEDLLSFVRGCDPSVVYTVHGHVDRFAAEVRSRLGIEAVPLREGRPNLLQF